MLVANYRAGRTVRELSKKFYVHRGTVAAHLERQGIQRRVSRRKLTDKDVTMAAGCYEAGRSLEIVGKAFGSVLQRCERNCVVWE